MGFNRRFSSFPPIDTIEQIEGIVIVDLPPPSSIQGLDTGVAACVGEFVDVTYGVAFNGGTGVFSTSARPVEIFSAQDLLNKVGGFDATLGQFGDACGNGFTSLRNKRFSRLVLVPINIASQYGMRAWRDLPTNVSATVALPITAVAGAILGAGTEFKNAGNRVRTAMAKSFASGQHSQNGTDGTVVNVAPATTQAFTSATAHFTRQKVGDVIVMGVIGAAGAQGANAGTYRIQAITNDTDIVLEKMDGSAFAFSASAAMAWRAHDAAQADTGVGSINGAQDATYTIAARPLDATIAQGLALTPTTIPTAGSATQWNPLSGLTGKATSNAAGIVYTAGVQAPNAPNAAAIDTLYGLALDALLNDSEPSRSVNILWAARKSATIRTSLRTHVDTRAANGHGLMAIIAPALSTVSLETVLGDADPGAGANRDERLIYNWPGAQTFVPEAVGIAVKIGDGTTTSDGMLDDTTDAWAAQILSNLPPERNPAQTVDPVPALMAPVVGFQRGAVPSLGFAEYVRLRAAGVMALKNERNVGFVFQSGVDTDLSSAKRNINRRRMADFIEDSIADALVPFNKDLLTDQNKDGAVQEIHSFLDELVSINNPAAQRIVSYLVDAKSGNTKETLAQGIFVIIVKVQMLPTADFIVLQFQVGPGVDTSA